MSPAKTAEPIEIPFGVVTRIGPRNHVLHGGADPFRGRGNFWGRVAVHCKQIMLQEPIGVTRKVASANRSACLKITAHAVAR